MPSPDHAFAAGEGARLALVESLGLFGTPPDPDFDAIAGEAARVTGYETALVTFMGADLCWFKAAAGTLAAPGMPREIPRNQTFCQFAIGSSGLFVVHDGLEQARFSSMASVSAPGGFRAYAGVQLITPEGLSVGSLCVLDRSPRTPTDGDRAALRRLADRTLELIAGRRRSPAGIAADTRDMLLVAEDEECIRTLLSDVFSRQGLRTLFASDGAEALRLYRENADRIAVVLTDYKMPLLSGLELVRALAQMPRPPACIVMSAYLEDSDRHEFAAAGVAVALRKPFTLAELSVVNDLVEAATTHLPG